MWELVGSAGELLEGLFAGVARGGRYLWEGASNLMTKTSLGRLLAVAVNGFFLGDILYKIFGSKDSKAAASGDSEALLSTILNPVVLASLAVNDRGSMEDLSEFLNSYGQSLLMYKGNSRLTAVAVLSCSSYIQTTKLRSMLYTPEQAMKILTDLSKLCDGLQNSTEVSSDDFKQLVGALEKSYDHKEFSVVFDFLVYALEELFTLLGSIGLRVNTNVTASTKQ